MDELFKWLPLVALAVNLLVVWVAWSIRKLAAEELRTVRLDVERQIGKIDQRLTHVEAWRDHQPSPKEFTDLRVEVTRLGGAIAAVDHKIDAVAQTVRSVDKGFDNINEFLLNKGRDA